MRWHVKPLLLFVLVFVVTIFCMLALGNCTSTVQNGSVLHTDLPQPVEITGLVYDESIGGYEVTIYGISKEQNLSLALNNSFLDIWQDDEQLLSSGMQGDNQYLIMLPIRAPKTGDAFRLRIYADPPAGKFKLFNFSGSLCPSIWLGDTAFLERFIQLMGELQLILLGSYTVLVCIFLLFYLKKRESYLLNAALIALAQGLINISFMNTQLIHLPYSFYRIIRSAIYNVPLALIVYMCVSAVREELPSSLSRFVELKTFFFLMVFAITISWTMKINMYQIMRRIYIVVVVFAFSTNKRTWSKDKASMLITYAIAEGIAHHLQMTDVVSFSRRGLLAMFIRPSQYQYLPFLVCYLIQSVGKFTHDFIDTEISLEINQQENSRFEALVAQRTGELLAEQQRRNNMMLKIFHDLRSPIFVMKSGLGRLKLADAESEDILSTIQSRLSYLERLTENLFMSAKMDENEVLYDMDYVRLDTLLEKIVSAEKVMAQERGVRIEMREALACFTWGDALRLQQAFFNLIDNAILYSREGGEVDIRIECEKEDVLVSVRDNGVGIADEDIGRIFERYYRSKRRKQSSGLGLYIAREIVEKHGGLISVRSTLGEGSEFTVKLPQCPQEEMAND